jgi:hypothetical protein
MGLGAFGPRVPGDLTHWGVGSVKLSMIFYEQIYWEWLAMTGVNGLDG